MKLFHSGYEIDTNLVVSNSQFDIAPNYSEADWQRMTDLVISAISDEAWGSLFSILLPLQIIDPTRIPYSSFTGSVRNKLLKKAYSDDDWYMSICAMYILNLVSKQKPGKDWMHSVLAIDIYSQNNSLFNDLVSTTEAFACLKIMSPNQYLPSPPEPIDSSSLSMVDKAMLVGYIRIAWPEKFQQLSLSSLQLIYPTRPEDLEEFGLNMIAALKVIYSPQVLVDQSGLHVEAAILGDTQSSGLPPLNIIA